MTELWVQKDAESYNAQYENAIDSPPCSQPLSIIDESDSPGGSPYTYLSDSDVDSDSEIEGININIIVVRMYTVIALL